jgi:hypothetical protein
MLYIIITYTLFSFNLNIPCNNFQNPTDDQIIIQAFQASNLFEILILLVCNFHIFHLPKIMSAHMICLYWSFTYWQSAHNVCNKPAVSITVSSSKRSHYSYTWVPPSIKMRPILLCIFPPRDIHAYLWIPQCGNTEWLTIRYFYVAEVTI